jgi:tRNA (guanine10-N2)-dimethyltransferase
MSDFLVILGRQPALGLAELESLYGADNVRPVGAETAMVKSNTVDFDRLGGAMKLGKVQGTLDATEWRAIESALIKAVPEHISRIGEGKIQLGVSAYGFVVSPQQMLATGLSLKKAIKKAGRSVRLTPNKEPALNSAQVLHNHLTGATGWEIILAKDGSQTIIAQTIAVQDIDAYTLRDRGRPKRDPRVGMLPPKLSQIIINLAGTSAPAGKRVLDPFCGTGVVLQEALLMGYDVVGTDLEPRMIDYTRTNLGWLARYHTVTGKYELEVGDATNHQWPKSIDLVACETYLGRPFTTSPNPEVLAQTVAECNLIIKKFLQNIAAQVPSDTRLCVAVPAWKQTGNTFKHLPLLDQIEQLGYNRMSFEHVRDEDLIYHRENQIVARELLVITRK